MLIKSANGEQDDRKIFVPRGSIDRSGAELVTILQEECAEVIVAASKLLRFGKEAYEGYGDNQTVLAHEIGDLIEMIDRAETTGLIATTAVEHGMKRKAERLKQFSRTM